MSQQSTVAGRTTPRNRSQTASVKTERSVVIQSPMEPNPPHSLLPELLSQLKHSVTSATATVAKAQETLTKVSTDLSQLLPQAEESDLKVTEEQDPETLQNLLFEQVKQAVLTADVTIDRICFKKRPASAVAESKKGVTAALEQMADEIWRAVAEGADKPTLLQVSKSLSALAQLTQQLDTVKHSVEAAMHQAETALQVPIDLSPQEGCQSRDELATELSSEGQRMLSSFTRLSGSKRLDKSQVPPLRQEMDGILGDMVAAVQSSRKGSEDAEGWKLKKEVARIKQKVQNLCKAMEDAESRDNSVLQGEKKSRRQKSMMSEELEAYTEFSERSSIRPMSVHSLSLDTEEIKSELAKHLRDSEKNVLSVLTEQKHGLSTVSDSQITIQRKQDELHSEVSEIKRRLFELFPVRDAQSRGKQADYTREVALLRSMAPDIRASSDAEFMEKFTKWFSGQRRQLDSFLSSLSTGDSTFQTLDEVAAEVQKLRSTNQALEEENQEAVIKMIRAQSEYEIEVEYQKARWSALEQELAELRENAVNSDEVVALRLRVEELTTENARLKGDAFDVSSVEPRGESELDLSKNDEMAYLKLQLHEHKQRLARLLDEKRHLDARIASQSATPSELMALSETQQKCDREAAEVKRLTRQIQSSDTFEQSESVATRELEMKPADEKVAKQIMTLLTITEGFEICGTVSYEGAQWALVKVGQGYVWVKTSLTRYSLSNEEMVMEHAQALLMLETSPRLPKSVVLALGHLMEISGIAT